VKTGWKTVNFQQFFISQNQIRGVRVIDVKTGVETLVEKLVWGRGGESEHLVKNHVWDADQDVEKLFGGGMGNTSENSDDVLSIVLPRFPACFFELPETTSFCHRLFTDFRRIFTDFHRFVTDFSQFFHKFFTKVFPWC